jgi:hypothetical protein
MKNASHYLLSGMSLPTWVCAGMLALSGIAHAAAPQAAAASAQVTPPAKTIASATPVSRTQSQSVDSVANALGGRLQQMLTPAENQHGR